MFLASTNSLCLLGDLGTKFYFILKGSIYLLINKGGLHSEPVPNKEEEKEKLRDSANSQNSCEHDFPQNKPTMKLLRTNSLNQARKAADILLSRRKSYRLSRPSSGSDVLQALVVAQLGSTEGVDNNRSLSSAPI